MNTSKPEKSSCVDCEPSLCNPLGQNLFICNDTAQCWASTMREKDIKEGKILYSCIGNPYQAQYECNRSQTVGGNILQLECCETDFCKNVHLFRARTISKKVPEEFDDNILLPLKEERWAILGFVGGILICMLFLCLFKLIRRWMEKDAQRSIERDMQMQERVPNYPESDFSDEVINEDAVYL